MSDTDSSESESNQPLAKKAKTHYDTLSSDSSQQINDKKKERQKRYRERNREKLKQREAERRKFKQHLRSIAGQSTSSNINKIELNNEEIIATISQSSSGSEGTPISFIQRNKQVKEVNALQKRRDRQQRYKVQNREKLKQREAERRKCKQYSQSIAGPSTSSNINSIELNNEEIIAAISQSSSVLQGTQTSSIQRNKEIKEINALQKKRDRQQRYRMQNREKLKQREAERRQRLQNAAMITESSTSSNIELTEIINEPIIDEISTNSRNVADLEEMQHLFKWLPVDESVDLSNFSCTAKFKRQDVRTAGVVIYKTNNTSHITTFNMDLAVQNATEVQVSQTSIGNVCASHVTLEDGREFIMIMVYISPNEKMFYIISFLHEKLFSYSHRGSMIFKTNKHKLPLILAGNFNINFAKDESMPLITFLQEEFKLQINSNLREHTTRYGTTIDAIFTRYIDNVMSNTSVTYFNYHRAIFTVIPPDTTSNITIAEVTDLWN